MQIYQEHKQGVSAIGWVNLYKKFEIEKKYCLRLSQYTQKIIKQFFKYLFLHK